MKNLLFLLAKLSIFYYILLGIFLGLILYWLNIVSIQEDLKTFIGITCIPYIFIYLLNSICCEYFYGNEKYKSIMPKLGKNIGIPNSDPFFREHFKSSISNFQKLAGYGYVFCKVTSSLYLGAIFALGFTLINK